MDKAFRLKKIAQEIAQCLVCQNESLGKPVPGEGNSDAEFVFIGEAPGKQEAQTGRPFVGRSGQLLRCLIQNIGLKEDDVYITSPVKYLPKRGTPTRKDIKHGKTHLGAQLAIIKPKIIVLLGKVAALGVLGEDIPVLQKHGEIILKNGIKHFITIHPAAALRIQKLRPIIKEDFKKLKNNIES